MDRSLVVFGSLFLVLPVLLAVGVAVLPSAAFGLTLALIAVIAFGFMFGVAFLDLREA